ncbi:Uncharacterised protein [Mycobacteroides abscessus subsp. abscessus]|nr:Uncharacterised protein [Mycobacteroides abscessus subsp. abscessus]
MPLPLRAASEASMNGPGPQMKASCSAKGAVSVASCCCEGSPCTDSSQWMTVSRSGYLAASSRSVAPKITDCSSRLA